MTSTISSNLDEQDEGAGVTGFRRRRFLGYVLGGSTLIAAAELSFAGSATADGIPSAPQIPEVYDLEDAQTDAALPTSQLIQIVINTDGTASFELPRSENGQGVTTSTAMIIAEELDIALKKVKVTLAPARPELFLNQLTGGSNTTFSTYTPIRVAAAIARRALLDAAANRFETDAERLEVIAGVITNTATGETLTFGDLAEEAAGLFDREVEVELKDDAEMTIVGTPRGRDDARLAVTGAKDFAMDLDIAGALPTMICRAPTLNGTPRVLQNRSAILAMPGVAGVAQVSTGIAVRARTFGQCIDAIRAMKVSWNQGSVEGESDETILAELRRAELPFTPVSQVPDLPLLGNKTHELSFEFMFRSSAALEPYAAVADVRADSAEVWAGLKSPILAQQDIAKMLGLSQEQVTVNVVTGGGSFGHKLFSNHALEAAECSRALGNVPVRLMWHRADEPRQGRLHPMVTSRIRAVTAPALIGTGRKVFAFEQRNTSVVTDFSHGFGEVITSTVADLPAGLGELSLSQTIFVLTQELGYDFGAVTQLLNEVDSRFNTGSMRNIYSPDTRVAAELMVDVLAKDADKDPLEYRLEFLRNEETKRALEKVAEEGNWGRRMPAGTAQGIAIHKEYKGVTACLVEIDCRPGTVNRDIREAVTGPRVTKGVFAIDAGKVINPRGLEAQMIGGFSDGIAMTLTASVHLKAGHFLEASWDNYFYTRQWNVPPALEVHILPSDKSTPGGAGEAGVAATAAATACAYVRATGTMPTRFPIAHDTSLSAFTPKSFVPPVPPSPTNGLKLTR
ncbi:molybdopterin cofactor-binding domain-containing protein [Nocardioides sp. AX2bis]|uniref:molybdopterin cofactor-binding domain-containing protein n=1 Tax=Nocardioides sp. AX2bis TaxID=2653157 RepID=UPI0012F03341|nr:molybdopterin cofactor-binding domain-containing protein [Nocardioides sp. AX2bis]VXC31901.1 Isoquinoline 1-oxidoreductase beta subunit [Nocardioides sp. AX2bis]